jgi:hypothetical protein
MFQLRGPPARYVANLPLVSKLLTSELKFVVSTVAIELGSVLSKAGDVAL